MKCNLGICVIALVVLECLVVANPVSGPTFLENESKRIAGFSKMANCGRKPLKKRCPECMKPTTDGFKMFFFHQYSVGKKLMYKFFLHYNDAAKTIVVSFGGPSVDNHKYIKGIYSKGWSYIKNYKVRIEKEYGQVYFKKLRAKLIEKVKKIKKSGRATYRFIFNGYSMGGSLATLAAFDLTKSGVVTKLRNNVTVYTYGALRIGDTNFVDNVNSTLTLWRIVKRNDFMTRIPNCRYFNGMWRCYTRNVLRRAIIRRTFPLRMYVRRYVNQFARGPLGKLTPCAGVNTGNTGYAYNTPTQQVYNPQLNTPTAIPVTKQVITQTQTRVPTMTSTTTYSNQRQPQPQTQMQYNYTPGVWNNNFRVEGKTNQLQKMQGKVMNNHNQQYQQFQQYRQFLETGAEVKSKSKSESKTKSKSKSKYYYIFPKTLVTPQIVPNGSLSTVRRVMYSNYIRFIYYTQPIGRQIFYNSRMTTYRPCNYMNGISSCERLIRVPTTFTNDSHRVYYGIDFSTCSQ